MVEGQEGKYKRSMRDLLGWTRLSKYLRLCFEGSLLYFLMHSTLSGWCTNALSQYLALLPRLADGRCSKHGGVEARSKGNMRRRNAWLAHSQTQAQGPDALAPASSSPVLLVHGHGACPSHKCSCRGPLFLLVVCMCIVLQLHHFALTRAPPAHPLHLSNPHHHSRRLPS